MLRGREKKRKRGIGDNGAGETKLGRKGWKINK